MVGELGRIIICNETSYTQENKWEVSQWSTSKPGYRVHVSKRLEQSNKRFLMSWGTILVSVGQLIKNKHWQTCGTEHVSSQVRIYLKQLKTQVSPKNSFEKPCIRLLVDLLLYVYLECTDLEHRNFWKHRAQRAFVNDTFITPLCCELSKISIEVLLRINKIIYKSYRKFYFD